MALRVTSEAIQVHGGYGFTDEFPVSRFYRGARYGTLGVGKRVWPASTRSTASSDWACSELFC
jgi:Acyl-CoA dehydrogenase, C-terminal domain